MNCHSTCERGRVSAANYAAGMISVTGWSCALQLAHQQHCASKNGEQNSLLDLYEAATRDYLSVTLWCSYLELAQQLLFQSARATGSLLPSKLGTDDFVTLISLHIVLIIIKI